MKDRKLLSMKIYQLLLEDCHDSHIARTDSCPACSLAIDMRDSEFTNIEMMNTCNYCFMRNKDNGYANCVSQGKEDYQFIFEQECGLDDD